MPDGFCGNVPGHGHIDHLPVLLDKLPGMGYDIMKRRHCLFDRRHPLLINALYQPGIGKLTIITACLKKIVKIIIKFIFLKALLHVFTVHIQIGFVYIICVFCHCPLQAYFQPERLPLSFR